MTLSPQAAGIMMLGLAAAAELSVPRRFNRLVSSRRKVGSKKTSVSRAKGKARKKARRRNRK